MRAVSRLSRPSRLEYHASDNPKCSSRETVGKVGEIASDKYVMDECAGCSGHKSGRLFELQKLRSHERT
jgi:hypothetical protein